MHILDHLLICSNPTNTSYIFSPSACLLLVHAAFTHPPGKAIQGCREKFIVATKCGIVKTDSGLIFDGSCKHVREACEASLKRLGTDYIDLFYLHR